ncbi:MAG: chloride channel protein [Legionellales bacterium RIFCSPHIGHO2_12_FULL_42_9]|nr:MAG: chloride channel protein [Legionellales bacterium RIFCSPHIGHO2_12_FULL_42_9]
MNKSKLLNLYLIALLLGGLIGMLGSCFKLLIDYLSDGLSHTASAVSIYGIPEFIISSAITVVFVVIAWWMVVKIAPEASGSGVQEIEGILLHKRYVNWRRLLPVKFIGGIFAISAKMVVGREGPMIQMGGNCGEMLGEWFNITRYRRDTLIAAGAAAGLATAFNAPIAGILFMIEEMRAQFNFSFTNFKTVAITCVAATIAMRICLGAGPAIPMAVFSTPDLPSLSLFFVLGLIVGLTGLVFNRGLMACLALKDKWSFKKQAYYVAGIAALAGLLVVFRPYWVGGGYDIIEQSLTLLPNAKTLLLVFTIRFCMTLLCYTTGVPGGIFAPMLALGTLIGLFCYDVFNFFIFDLTIHPGMFAVAGMGALFSAVVRAPMTGIVLVVEMTQNYNLILPVMVSCLTATTVMQFARNEPIYTQLLQRTLRAEEVVASPAVT